MKETVPSYINRTYHPADVLTVMYREQGEDAYKVGLSGYDAYTTANAFCAKYGHYWLDSADGKTVCSTYTAG